MEQRSSEWFDVRLGKVTASGFGNVMASPYTATYKNYRTQIVLERLSGVVQEGFKSSAMDHGIETEEEARQAYSLQTGNEVTEAFFVEHETLEAGASPDGYVGEDGLIEIKCPNTSTHIETLKAQKVPTKYIPQIQGQLWITGRKWCDFVSYDPRLPENAQMFIYRVERDEVYIKELKERIEKFLSEIDSDYDFISEYELRQQ